MYEDPTLERGAVLIRAKRERKTWECRQRQTRLWECGRCGMGNLGRYPRVGDKCPFCAATVRRVASLWPWGG